MYGGHQFPSHCWIQWSISVPILPDLQSPSADPSSSKKHFVSLGFQDPTLLVFFLSHWPYLLSLSLTSKGSLRLSVWTSSHYMYISLGDLIWFHGFKYNINADNLQIWIFSLYIWPLNSRLEHPTAYSTYPLRWLKFKMRSSTSPQSCLAPAVFPSQLMITPFIKVLSSKALESSMIPLSFIPNIQSGSKSCWLSSKSKYYKNGSFLRTLLLPPQSKSPSLLA